MLHQVRQREPNMILDADHARNPARVELRASAPVRPIDDAGYRHQPVFDFDLQPVARDSNAARSAPSSERQHSAT